MLVNEICRNDNFCYFQTEKQMNKGYKGSIRISNKHRDILNNENNNNTKS